MSTGAPPPPGGYGPPPTGGPGVPPPPGGPGVPPPPGNYGAPPPPYGAPGPGAQNGMGTAALIMGILQFICLGPIGSILAIIFGILGSKKAKQGLATNGGMAKAGLWLGVVGLVLAVVSIVAMAVLGVGLFKAAEASLDPANNTKTGLADGSYAMDPSAYVTLGDRCSFTGEAYDAETEQTAAAQVTVVGTSRSQCAFSGTPMYVTFDVTGGTAVVTSVE